MSVYVIADIHGCYKDFMKLIKKSDFKWENDELIIAGDLIERGPDNYKMLKWMEDMPECVTVLMGNHDFSFMNDCLMFIDYVDKYEFTGNLRKFIKEYPGVFNVVKDKYHTIRELIRKNNTSYDDLVKWSSIISRFDYTKELMVNEKEYIIVHAGYLDTAAYSDPDFLARRYGFNSEKHFNLWARREAKVIGGKSGATIISGHSPTILDLGYFNNGRIYRYYDKSKDCYFINIDCGCCYRKYKENANLAMIRLGDEKEYYLK